MAAKRPSNEEHTVKEIPEDQRPSTFNRLWEELRTAVQCFANPPDVTQQWTAIDVFVRTRSVFRHERPIRGTDMRLVFAPHDIAAIARTEPPPSFSGFMYGVSPAKAARFMYGERAPNIRPAPVDPTGLESYPCDHFDPPVVSRTCAPGEHRRRFWINQAVRLGVSDPLSLIIRCPQGLFLSQLVIPLIPIPTP